MAQPANHKPPGQKASGFSEQTSLGADTPPPSPLSGLLEDTNKLLAISPELEKLALAMEQNKENSFREHRVTQNRLINDYIDIHDRAVAGKTITAEDFNKAEGLYNDANEKSVQTLVGKNKELRAQADSEVARLIASGKIAPTEKASMDLHKTFDGARFEMEKMLERYRPPDHIDHEQKNALLNDTAPLDAAFRREYIDGKFYSKDLTLSPGTHDGSGLIANVMDHNGRMAVVDKDTFKDSTDFVAQHMAELKAKHVDTIYVEGNESTSKMITMPLSDLKRMALDLGSGDNDREIRERTARMYHSKSSDNTTVGWIHMIATAREQGIDVVNIDKKGDVRTDEIHLSNGLHRIASTNFQWTEAIKSDRSKQHKTGSYVVVAGMDHFMQDTYLFAGVQSNGMVDDALGIPVLALTRSEPGLPPLMRGLGSGGPDFFLAAGDNYPKTRERALSENVLSLQQLMISPIMPEAVKKTGQFLQKLGVRLKEDAQDSMQLDLPATHVVLNDRLTPPPKTTVSEPAVPSLRYAVEDVSHPSGDTAPAPTPHTSIPELNTHNRKQ